MLSKTDTEAEAKKHWEARLRAVEGLPERTVDEQMIKQMLVALMTKPWKDVVLFLIDVLKHLETATVDQLAVWIWSKSNMATTLGQTMAAARLVGAQVDFELGQRATKLDIPSIKLQMTVPEKYKHVVMNDRGS